MLPLLVLALLGTCAEAAISGCATLGTGWHSIETSCPSDCYDPSCGGGWSSAIFESCGCCACDRDACKREVCTTCNNGYYKSGFSHNYATTCTQCPGIIGCYSGVTCSSKDNSQCTGCYSGRYLKESSTYSPADACPECTSIPNCKGGKLTCSSSTNQICSECNTGYFPSSDGKACEKCMDGCYSCKSRSLALANDKCITCASDYVKNNAGSSCIASCPAGQYATGNSISGGKEYCEYCSVVSGCAVAAHCSITGANSYCPNGDCLSDHYARSNNICYLRVPAPTVSARGPFAEIFYDGLVDQDCSGYPTAWSDSAGDSCAWYVDNNAYCGELGRQYENDGHSAKEACCTCNGGSDKVYIDSTWEAEIQQQNNQGTTVTAISSSTNVGLDLEWKDFNGQLTPERSFRVRLKRTRKSDGMIWESLWSEYFEFSCECDGRDGKDGEMEVALTQHMSNVKFHIDYHSYCANSYIIERNAGESGYELNKDWATSIMNCDKPSDNTRYDDLAINNQVTASIGQTIYYRFFATNSVLGYTNHVEKEHLVQFWSILKGTVRSKSIGGVQIPNVKITASVDPSFSSEPVVISDLTQAINGNNIEYHILVQSANISAQQVPVIVTAQYPADTPSWSFCSAADQECVCSGGLIRLTNGSEHLTKEDISLECNSSSFSGVTPSGTLYCECSAIMHRFDCTMVGEKCVVSDESVPVEQQTHHVEMDLHHTETTTVTFFDMSTYTVGGKVTIYDTEEYTASKRACGLEGVKICPFVADDPLTRLPQLCVETDVEGNYEIAVPAGQSLTLIPTYLNGTSDDFTVSARTLSSVFSNDLSQDFEYRVQNRVDITVGGGDCFFPIGTFNLRFTIDSCADYNREVPWAGKDQIYLGPADFTVRVDSFEPDANLNDEDISDGSVTAYLSNIQHQTKYIKFFSRNDTDKLAAKFTSQVGNAELEFMFRSVLQYDFDARPGSPAGLVCGDVTVAAQNSFGNLYVLLFEQYGDLICNKISGQITVVDQVTDVEYDCTRAEGCTVDIGIVEHPAPGTNKSGLVLPLFPGEPNLVPNHHRYFSFYWDDPGRSGEEGVAKTFPILVTGQRKMGDSFSVTLSEGNPRTILYDPPGASSFAELSEGVTLQSGLTVTSGTGLGLDTSIESVLGVQEDVTTCAGIGAALCKKLLALKVSAGVVLENSFVDGEEEGNDFTYSLTVENSVSTSEEANFPGFYSDVVVLSAFTVTYERTRKLEVIAQKCSDGDEDFVNIYDTAIYRPSLDGFAVKTFFDIEFVELPKIDDNMEIIQGKLERDEYTPDADGTEEKSLDLLTQQKLNATKANYNRIIASHKDRAESGMIVSPNSFFQDVACNGAKGECSKLGGERCANGDIVDSPCGSITDASLFDFGSNNNRIFFAGGGTTFGLSTETATETVESYALTYDTEHVNGLQFENKATIGSMLLETNVQTQIRVEHHSTSETVQGRAKAKTVAFTLSDPDVGDYFDVEIFYDKEYGTPFFKTIAGASMCPGEDGTVQRMQVKMDVQGLRTIEGIPEDSPYVLPVDITNESPTDEEGNYILTYDQSSNPNGIMISVDGEGLEERLLRGIPVGENLRVNVRFDRAPGKFDYEDLALVVVAQCEIDLDMVRDPIGDDLVVSLHYQQICSKVEFSGQIADYNTFTVKKDALVSSQAITVIAHNPDNFLMPWTDHPFLEDIHVQYRRLGDNIWKRATKADGTFENLKSKANSEGFAETLVDVSTWEDGEYEMSLTSYCGNKPGALGSYTSEAILGRVDRVEPRIFGSFAEPADALWSPGDRIAVRMTEDIDCRTPYTFNAHIVIKGEDSQVVVDNDHLDLKCEDDMVELAFSPYSLLYSLPDLLGKEITVYVENARDLAGNFQEDTVSWSFLIEDFDLNNAAVLLSLYFKDLSIEDYSRDPDSFESQVVSEVCFVADCEDGQQPKVTDVREGSIWLDLEWQQQTNASSPAALLYQRLGNSTESSTVPDSMILAGAQLRAVSYSPVKPENTEQRKESATSSGGTNVGAIVGGVIGGVVVVAVVLFAIRRQRKTRNAKSGVDGFDEAGAETSAVNGKVSSQTTTDIGVEPQSSKDVVSPNLVVAL